MRAPLDGELAAEGGGLGVGARLALLQLAQLHRLHLCQLAHLLQLDAQLIAFGTERVQFVATGLQLTHPQSESGLGLGGGARGPLGHAALAHHLVGLAIARGGRIP